MYFLTVFAYYTTVASKDTTFGVFRRVVDPNDGRVRKVTHTWFTAMCILKSSAKFATGIQPHVAQDILVVQRKACTEEINHFYCGYT
jgi:hypothetical protein